MSVTENKTSTAPAKEPMFEVAQLAHVELFTPKPDETVRFFTELLGLEETEREGQSACSTATPPAQPSDVDMQLFCFCHDTPPTTGPSPAGESS